MANIPAKLAKLNKLISYALHACRKYKGKGMVHFWTRQALRYLLLAKQSLKLGEFTLYRFELNSALTRINWANAERMIMGA